MKEMNAKLRREEVKTTKRKTEPYVLYIKHSLTDPYVMVGQFDSSFEAQRYLDENYKGFAHKIMSVKDAIKEGEKQEERARKRKEMVTKTGKAVVSGAKAVGRGAVAVGKGVAKASEAVGEAEEKYKEYWEGRDIKAAERETRELARLRAANKRMAIRIEQQKLRERQKLKAERLRGELQEKEQRPAFGSGFQPPGRKSGFTFSPPSPLSSQGSFGQQRPIGRQQKSFGGPVQRPAGFGFQAPIDIRWKPPQAQPAQQLAKKKKKSKKKSKKGKK